MPSGGAGAVAADVATPAAAGGGGSAAPADKQGGSLKNLMMTLALVSLISQRRGVFFYPLSFNKS